MALGIFSENCIWTSLCGGLGTFTLREFECFRLVLVVKNIVMERSRTRDVLCWIVCHG